MEIKYCAKCQCRVSSVDISEGDGLKFGGKYYCEDCVVKYKIREQLASAAEKKKSGTGATMAVKPAAKPESPVSSPESSDKALEAENSSEEPADPDPGSKQPVSRWKTTPVGGNANDGEDDYEYEDRPTKRKKSPMPMIMIIVGVIVLIAAMAAVILKRPSSTGFGGKKRKIKQNIPYSGTPLRVPGKIEAEHYDKGGDGVAYSDNDGMNHGSFVGIKFRPDEGVDMDNCRDSGGGYMVSLIEKDEWVEYTIDVPNTGTYDINFRVSSPGGFDIILQPFIDGKSVSKPKRWGAPPGENSWSSAPIRQVRIETGIHILRVEFGETGWNLNWIEIVKSE